MCSVSEAIDFAAETHLFRDSSTPVEKGRCSRIVDACAIISEIFRVSAFGGVCIPPWRETLALYRSIRESSWVKVLAQNGSMF
jgi:hypothetical protein